MLGRKTPEAIEIHDGWEDPLAVQVGLGVGVDDMPEDGWPDEFDPETVDRILSYLPGIDEPPTTAN